MNLYTIEAEVNYDDLPVNLKHGWSPGFGAAFLDYVGENQKDVLFLSLSGRLQKKCIFIGDEALATQLADHLTARATKRKRTMAIRVRPVDSGDLAYRKKKAAIEAAENDAAIRQILASAKLALSQLSVAPGSSLHAPGRIPPIPPGPARHKPHAPSPPIFSGGCKGMHTSG